MHTRPYRNTSLLVDFFTYEFGRITAVAKGARQKKPRFAGAIRPFTPIYISLIGNKELKTLTQVEIASASVPLTGKQLFCGMYLNELIQRVLQPFDAHHEVYEAYERALGELAGEDLEVPLRRFEFLLLSELGYGINFADDCRTGDPIEPESSYFYDPEAGFYLEQDRAVDQQVFRGVEIIAVGQLQVESPHFKRASKILARLAIASRLGSKPLKSRELFS